MQKSRVILVILTLLAFVCSASVASAADWSNAGGGWHRDNTTGLLWSNDTGNVVTSYDQARSIAKKMGGRLPTWEEIRDVVNNRDAIYELDMQTGPLDFYETAKSNELCSAYGGSISSKFPRNYFWAVIGKHRVIVVKP